MVQNHSPVVGGDSSFISSMEKETLLHGTASTGSNGVPAMWSKSAFVPTLLD